MLAGDNAEAIRVGIDALALVDDLGLDRLRPRALSRVGTARLGVGDLGGLGGLERAVAESLQLTSPDSVVAYINLASALIELARGFELQAQGLRMTERFGFGGYVRHLVAERVIEDYWRGRRDAAAGVADEFVAESEAGTRHQVEPSCRQVRGSIRLARADVPAALEDAAKGLALAQEVGDPPVLDPSLAFHARAFLAAGRVEEAGAYVSELLGVLADQAVAMVGVPTWTADLAVVLGPWEGAASCRPPPGTWCRRRGCRRPRRWPATTSRGGRRRRPGRLAAGRGVRPPARRPAAARRRPASQRRHAAAACPGPVPPGRRHRLPATGSGPGRRLRLARVPRQAEKQQLDPVDVNGERHPHRRGDGAPARPCPVIDRVPPPVRERPSARF
jgi:hypothetical protein